MALKKKTIIDISVRDLIHYVYRGGDLDARFVGKSRALEGTKAHQVIQNKMGDNYVSEVSIKHVESRERLTINLTGRIDGIIKEDEHIIIDEIKSTLRNLGNLARILPISIGR
ncbi:MAG: hypothetical protein U9Q80_00490 [Bacillota bacterium]|nr:hypothetical protein [Bacillota bacterium]